MQNKKNIPSYNNKGQRHGYWELYCNSNRLRYKCFYVKNIEYGYTEYTKRKLTKKLYTAR
jgi:hypothetical protein